MSIVDALKTKKATPETVLEIMHTSVAELSGDKSEDEMLGEMRARSGDESQFAQMHERFQKDPTLIREAALVWLASASDDQAKLPVVTGAVEDADRSAPLIEVTAITVIAMYAMYLIATGGLKETTRKIEHRSDGSFIITEKRVYASSSEPIKGAIGMFKAAAGQIDGGRSERKVL